MSKKIKVLSLFDGISCGRVALERAGFEIEKYYASEIDKFAKIIAQKNYPDTIQVGDITKLKGEDYDVDLVMGGSPCQGFSFAGKQLNFDDPRSALFFEFVRLLKEIKPKYFLLENVRMKQEHQDVISEHLGVKPIMINSSLVSAQNRYRLYWTNIPNIEQPNDKEINLKSLLQNEEEVDEKYYLTENNIKTINRNFGSKGKIIDLEEDFSLIEKMNYPSRIKQKLQCIKCPTLTAAMGTGGGNVPVITIKEATKKGFVEIKDGECFDNTFPNSETRRGRKMDKKSNCLTAANYDYLLFKNERIRKLTEIECERLQTLPDRYTEDISMTQRYKALGNGWTVDVVAHILTNL